MNKSNNQNTSDPRNRLCHTIKLETIDLDNESEEPGSDTSEDDNENHSMLSNANGIIQRIPTQNIDCSSDDDTLHIDETSEPTMKMLYGQLTNEFGQQNYFCFCCQSRLFNTKKDLDEHLALKSVPTKPLGSRDLYYCDRCPKTFNKKIVLLSHKRKKHFKRTNCICQECGAGFINGKSLKQHMKGHRLAKTCVYCKKKFENMDERKEHEEVEHSDEVARKKRKQTELRKQKQLSSDEIPKKRGRPKGSKNKQNRKKLNETIERLSLQL